MKKQVAAAVGIGLFTVLVTLCHQRPGSALFVFDDAPKEVSVIRASQLRQSSSSGYESYEQECRKETCEPTALPTVLLVSFLNSFLCQTILWIFVMRREASPNREQGNTRSTGVAVCATTCNKVCQKEQTGQAKGSVAPAASRASRVRQHDPGLLGASTANGDDLGELTDGRGMRTRYGWWSQRRRAPLEADKAIKRISVVERPEHNSDTESDSWSTISGEGASFTGSVDAADEPAWFSHFRAIRAREGTKKEEPTVVTQLRAYVAWEKEQEHRRFTLMDEESSTEWNYRGEGYDNLIGDEELCPPAAKRRKYRHS